MPVVRAFYARASLPVPCAYHNKWPSVPEALYARRKLTDDEIGETFDPAARWQIQNGNSIAKECKDFVTPFSNMTRVALIANR